MVPPAGPFSLTAGSSLSYVSHLYIFLILGSYLPELNSDLNSSVCSQIERSSCNKKDKKHCSQRSSALEVRKIKKRWQPRSWKTATASSALHVAYPSFLDSLLLSYRLFSQCECSHQILTFYIKIFHLWHSIRVIENGLLELAKDRNRAFSPSHPVLCCLWDYLT